MRGWTRSNAGESIEIGEDSPRGPAPFLVAPEVETVALSPHRYKASRGCNA